MVLTSAKISGQQVAGIQTLLQLFGREGAVILTVTMNQKPHTHNKPTQRPSSHPKIFPAPNKMGCVMKCWV
jgi:ABC-type thiamine transport system ATPase subunit